MAEDQQVISGTKKEVYEQLIPQISAVINAEPDIIANMANTAAMLKTQFEWLWVGFYIVKNDQLVLGPFQGPLACTRIRKGRGVCGTAWELAVSIVVEDVNRFPGHIACSSLSQSEIVVPVLKDGRVVAVLDVDSISLATFDETDRVYLEQVCSLLSSCFD